MLFHCCTSHVVTDPASVTLHVLLHTCTLPERFNLFSCTFRMNSFLHRQAAFITLSERNDPTLPTMERHIDVITTMGLFEKLTPDVVERFSMNPRPFARARVHHAMLAIIFNCTEDEIFKHLRDAKLRRNHRLDPLEHGTLIWETTLNLRVTFLNFVAYAMMWQDRYNGARLGIRPPHPELQLLPRHYPTSRRRRHLREIWALFGRLKELGHHQLILVLRYKFEDLYGDMRLAIRSFT